MNEWHRIGNGEAICSTCGARREWVGRRLHRMEDSILAQKKSAGFGRDSHSARFSLADLDGYKVEPVNLTRVLL